MPDFDSWIEDGWLSSAQRIPSPNQDQRPDPDDIQLIVIHGISLPPGEYGRDWISAFFTNELPADAHPYFAEIHTLRVSAHLLILRDGHLIQYVPFHRRAWHAGVSSFAGRERCNDFSIGIELEGTDSRPYAFAQYGKLAEVLRILLRHYPGLSWQRIVGHSDIAPGRKTDPGPAFDWSRIEKPQNGSG